jgi:hypothetical protein
MFGVMIRTRKRRDTLLSYIRMDSFAEEKALVAKKFEKFFKLSKGTSKSHSSNFVKV